MFQNTNVSSIIEKEKMERNKQKDDAAKKKERDKVKKMLPCTRDVTFP